MVHRLQRVLAGFVDTGEIAVCNERGQSLRLPKKLDSRHRRDEAEFRRLGKCLPDTAQVFVHGRFSDRAAGLLAGLAQPRVRESLDRPCGNAGEPLPLQPHKPFKVIE